jgi:hypothetical protein
MDLPTASYLKGAKFKALCKLLKDIQVCKPLVRLHAQAGLLQVLVLEELYVFPAWLLDRVETLFRAVKAHYNPTVQHVPWGGIQVTIRTQHAPPPSTNWCAQVIANGDQMQSAKPWNKNEDSVWEGYKTIDFVFQLPGFGDWFDATVGLNKIYRTTDLSWIELLHRAGVTIHLSTSLSVTHPHTLTTPCTCWYDEIKGAQDQGLLSCSFSDSLSASVCFGGLHPLSLLCSI